MEQSHTISKGSVPPEGKESVQQTLPRPNHECPNFLSAQVVPPLFRQPRTTLSNEQVLNTTLLHVHLQCPPTKQHKALSFQAWMPAEALHLSPHVLHMPGPHAYSLRKSQGHLIKFMHM